MKNLYPVLSFCISLSAFAQNNTPEDAWLYFKDKPQAQAFFNQPLSLLSQRALDRRSAQNIALDISDAPIEKTYYDAVKNSPGISIMAQSRWLNAVHVRGQVNDLAELIKLAFAQKLVYATRDANALPPKAPKPKFITQKQNKNSDYSYGQATTQAELMHVPQLHQSGFTGQGKVIAVIDSGFPGVDVTDCFAALRQRNGIGDTYNYLRQSANVYQDFPHGTEVLSTMATLRNTEMVGTAPGANYLLYVTENIASETVLEESHWVEAAERADAMGADIINSSLGYVGFDNPKHNLRYQDLNGQVSVASQAASLLLGKGMVATIAAGNSGATNMPYIGAPADAKNILAVGSIQSNQQLSSFSSIGPSADQRIKPDVVAMGSDCTVCQSNGVLRQGSGTSYASPVLSGAIAALWSKYPKKTAAEIMETVKISAHLAKSPNNQYGYGLPNFAIADELLKPLPPPPLAPMLYPASFDEVLHISNPTQASTQLRIYTANGNLLWQQNDAQSLNTSHWQQGIYYYQLQLGNLTLYGKVIKS
jgi:serine protease AprX